MSKVPDGVRSLLQEIVDYPVRSDNSDAIKLQLLAAKVLLKLADNKTPHVDDIGRQGGLARAASLSPQRRREIAKLGAKSRWKDQGGT